LRGAFLADNHVDAIRLNGKPVRVSEHGDNQFFREFNGLFIEEGFRDGMNRLEIDVRNGCPSLPKVDNPMGLRVELSGSVLTGYRRNDEPPRGKEGAPMNGP
jgi:hypothetical protein